MTRAPGAYVRKDVCLPREVFHAPRDAACGRKWLRAGQPAPTAWKKSAEGMVAAGETSPAGAGRTHPDEGLNGAQPNGLGGALSDGHPYPDVP
jgi:hypothetical protein